MSPAFGKKGNRPTDGNLLMNYPLSRIWVCLLSAISLAGGCRSNAPIQYVVRAKYGVADPQFRRTIGNLLGPALIPGNTIVPLRNGDEIFPSMLAAIRSAKKTSRSKPTSTGQEKSGGAFRTRWPSGRRRA